MNIDILEKILTNEQPYWLVKKENKSVGINSQVFKPSIMMIIIPQKIEQGLSRDEIKLTDLERLQRVYLDSNVFLNEDYSPFQLGQTLVNVVEVYPIKCNQKEFLKQALILKSDSILDYKKIIDKLCS